MRAKTFSEVRKARTFSEIMKYNPYHDRLGRFATGGGAASFTYKPGASAAHDKSIEREKEKAHTAATQSNYEKLKQKYGTPDIGTKRTTDVHKFKKSIEDAKAANKHGGSVDTHTLKELKTFKTFLSKDGMAGVAVKPDGDITAVYKNPNSKSKGAVNDLILTARAHGGTKMDCYGKDLVNMYEKCGYVPVAKVKFNAAYVDDPVLLQKKPDVYVMMKNTDSLETVCKKNASNAYKKSTLQDLGNLKTFGKDDYEKALKYRDDLLALQ